MEANLSSRKLKQVWSGSITAISTSYILLICDQHTLCFLLGEVNVASCIVTQFNAKVPKEIKNDIVVLLVDIFNNPVPSQPSRLNLEITSTNTSSFTTWNFVDNTDGTYIGSYLAMDVGTFRMCVTFDDKHIQPCPFDVNVYSSKSFYLSFIFPFTSFICLWDSLPWLLRWILSKGLWWWSQRVGRWVYLFLSSGKRLRCWWQCEPCWFFTSEHLFLCFWQIVTFSCLLT